VRRCLRRGRPGPYQIQAAINAVHSDASRAAETDWTQILALYHQLLAINPTPTVALNRAVAVAAVQGPQAALALVDDPERRSCWRCFSRSASRLGRADSDLAFAPFALAQDEFLDLAG
jgi:RNA polymerase sigma-70 factor (ECF subfamily)